MPPRYLLPCPCGRKTPVDATQAGQTVTCRCGRSIEVPTLLRLRSLETLDEQPKARPAGSWRVSQGLAVVGAVVTLGAVAALIFFFLHRPTPPESIFTENSIRRDAHRLTLLGTYRLWEELRAGPSNSPRAGKEYLAALKTYRIPKDVTIDEAYAAAAKQYHIRIGTSLVILGLAVATTVGGWLCSRRQARDAPDDEPDDSLA